MLITNAAWEDFTLVADRPVGATDDLRRPKLRHLYDWWAGAAANGLPLRRAFDIVEHRAIATQLFLVEVLPEGRFRTKIVGSRAQQWVEETRERRILSAECDTPNMRWLFTQYSRVTASRAPWLTRGRVRLADRGEHDFEGIDCPLSEDGRTVSAIIGILDIL